MRKNDAVFFCMFFFVGCDWDGGDCCGAKGYKFCKECKCKDCNYKVVGDDCTPEIKGKCAKPSWKGDNNCDDENNNAGCAWGKIYTCKQQTLEVFSFHLASFSASHTC